MKSTLGLLTVLGAMYKGMGMDSPIHKSDPLKKTYKKGDYVPPPKQKESKKAKKRRKLGKR